MATITLHNPEYADTPADICLGHNGWPEHEISDHAALAGITPYSRDVRCDVCDLEWDERFAQQHTGCRALYSDGSRVCATPIITYRRRDELVTIAYPDEYGTGPIVYGESPL